MLALAVHWTQIHRGRIAIIALGRILVTVRIRRARSAKAGFAWTTVEQFSMLALAGVTGILGLPVVVVALGISLTDLAGRNEVVHTPGHRTARIVRAGVAIVAIHRLPFTPIGQGVTGFERAQVIIIARSGRVGTLAVYVARINRADVPVIATTRHALFAHAGAIIATELAQFTFADVPLAQTAHAAGKLLGVGQTLGAVVVIATFAAVCILLADDAALDAFGRGVRTGPSILIAGIRRAGIVVVARLLRAGHALHSKTELLRDAWIAVSAVRLVVDADVLAHALLAQVERADVAVIAFNLAQTLGFDRRLDVLLSRVVGREGVAVEVGARVCAHDAHVRWIGCTAHERDEESNSSLNSILHEEPSR